RGLGRGGRGGPRRRRQRRLLADLAEADAAVADRRDLVEEGGRVGRELDAEPLGELGDPLELVRTRRDDGAALALEPPLEVDRRPVTLEIARAGEDEVGEAGERVGEHAD